VVEWSRALDVRLSEWCCSVSLVWVQIPSSNLYKLSLILIDTEEGHLLIENVVNIYFVTPLSVSLHNLLDFYNNCHLVKCDAFENAKDNR
jgi:hypothetical protein